VGGGGGGGGLSENPALLCPKVSLDAQGRTIGPEALKKKRCAHSPTEKKAWGDVFSDQTTSVDNNKRAAFRMGTASDK